MGREREEEPLGLADDGGGDGGEAGGIDHVHPSLSCRLRASCPPPSIPNLSPYSSHTRAHANDLVCAQFCMTRHDATLLGLLASLIPCLPPNNPRDAYYTPHRSQVRCMRWVRGGRLDSIRQGFINRFCV